MGEAPEIYTKTSWEKKSFVMNFPTTLITSITSITTYYADPITIPALNVQNPIVFPSSLIFWIDGGDDGTDYKIVAWVVDNSGTREVGIGDLRVRDY